MQYIIKHSESEYAINELGVRVEAREILQDWSKDFSKKASAKEAWHLCFSIKEEVNPHNISALQQSVQEVLAKNFCEYKYVCVIHTHQNNPHIHVLINKNNLFTHKKLHFQTRGEIRNLFNGLQEDFAFALNFNGNLNYHNAYKFEKHNVLDFAATLEKEKKQKEYESLYNKQNNQTSQHNLSITNTPTITTSHYTKPPKHIDIMQNITQTLTKLEQKDSILQQKSIPIKEELEFLYETKKDLLAFLKECKADSKEDCKKDSKKKSNKDTHNTIKTSYNYKQSYTYYKTLKDIKIINTEIKALQQKLQSLTKDSIALQKSIREHGFMQVRIKNVYAKELQEDFISLAQKKEYLQFLIKHRPTITKEQSVILKALQQELNTESKSIIHNLKHTALDSYDLAVLQKLGLQHSSFSLIHARNTITKTLNILERIDRYYLDTESLKLYDTQKKTLQDNVSIIDSLLEKKLMFYDDYFKRFQELEKEKTQQQTQNHKAILQQSKEQQDSQITSQKQSDSLLKDSKIKDFLPRDSRAKDSHTSHSFTTHSHTTHTQNLIKDSKTYDPYNTKALLYNFKEFQALLLYFEDKKRHTENHLWLSLQNTQIHNHISHDTKQNTMSLDSHIETITQTSSEAKHLKATHTKSLNTIKRESQNRDSSAKQHAPSHKEKSHTDLYNNDSHTQSNIQHHSTQDSHTQQNVQQNTQQSSTHNNIQDSHTLSQFHKDFIEWYIYSRDIRNKDYYRKLLANKYKKILLKIMRNIYKTISFIFICYKDKEREELEKQK